jgi:hypothetical protein
MVWRQIAANAVLNIVQCRAVLYIMQCSAVQWIAPSGEYVLILSKYSQAGSVQCRQCRQCRPEGEDNTQHVRIRSLLHNRYKCESSSAVSVALSPILSRQGADGVSGQLFLEI